MTSTKIPKRVSTALLQSVGAGVVPRVGLEYIAVGRKAEVTALLDDLDNSVTQGGASFRLILGTYGSGKSFLGQLIRNYALSKNFVVADADLSPIRRLTGTAGQGINLYRELLNNLATRTRPDGNAFAALLERWISDIQNEVIQKQGINPAAPEFQLAVEQRIRATLSEMESLVHGFDFGTVVSAYWRGHLTANEELQTAALRWLRGEYSTKAEARDALGVRIIIDDYTWYEHLKLLARFVKDIGYKGLLVFLDEGVNLYKISNTVARQNNYERLLTIFNDTLQGKAEYIGIIVSGTPQMVEDRNRGLYSYDALRTRLEESRFARDGLRDLSGPILRLEVLKSEEIYLLLQRLRDVHAVHYNYTDRVSDAQIQQFMNEVAGRMGADQYLTPREVNRDFIGLLNILYQNPNVTFEALLNGTDFVVTKPEEDPEALTPESEIHESKINDDDTGSPYKNFTI